MGEYNDVKGINYFSLSKENKMLLQILEKAQSYDEKPAMKTDRTGCNYCIGGLLIRAALELCPEKLKNFQLGSHNCWFFPPPEQLTKFFKCFGFGDAVTLAHFVVNNNDAGRFEQCWFRLRQEFK